MKGYCLKKQGYFEIKRRYRDFYALRMCFIERYPGLYVPPVPKKKVSNESRVVLQERQFVLNIFWKDVTCCPYLMESEEFRVFISKTNNLEVALSGLSDCRRKEMIYLIGSLPTSTILGIFQERPSNNKVLRLLDLRIIRRK